MIVTVGVLQRLQIPGLVEADSQYFDEKVVEKMQLTLMILGDLSSDYKPKNNYSFFNKETHKLVINYYFFQKLQ